MNRKYLQNLHAWFNDYVKGYYSDDTDQNHVIRLKEEHTARVCSNIRMLGESLGMSDQEMRLLDAIALLHDVGRFPQYVRYHTFNDRASENHALLGLRRICIRGILADLNQPERRYIARSVAYHNSALLPVSSDQQSLLYIKLVRDADKLDIWKTAIDYYEGIGRQVGAINEFGLADQPYCSPDVLAAFNERRIVFFEDIRSLNDFKLLQISWVFDLNFPATYRAVREGRFIENIKSSMPVTRELNAALKEAEDYVARHL